MERPEVAIRQRYFRTGTDGPVNAHLIGCLFDSVGWCSCGLLHDLSLLDDEELRRELYPAFPEDLAEHRTAAVGRTRRHRNGSARRRRRAAC